MAQQIPMFDEELNEDDVRRSLDELFLLANQYTSSKQYWALLQFISRFPSYSIFNALLVNIQMPGAVYVAPAARWKRDYHRRIKLGAQPLVILRPMGPVMFVFDISDTEEEENAPPLPNGMTNPFAIEHGFIRNELDKTIENALRDGVQVTFQNAGALKAGSIEAIENGQFTQYPVCLKPHPEYVSVPLRYGILLNAKQSKETQYASLVHELAHLYCGHLGSPDERWWPNRKKLPRRVYELEAESVCYLVCKRIGIENPSEKYLADYVKENETLSRISLDSVMKSATLIEQMGKERLKPRDI